MCMLHCSFRSIALSLENFPRKHDREKNTGKKTLRAALARASAPHKRRPDPPIAPHTRAKRPKSTSAPCSLKPYPVSRLRSGA
eukprot:1728802-Prymnesium_polylepis.1